MRGEGGYDFLAAIALDRRGNVVVTGGSTGIGTSADFATVSYSSTGVPLWTHRYDGPVSNPDVATALATDRQGNVFVAGYSYGPNGYTDFLTINFPLRESLSLFFRLRGN